ncbi:MAG: hypothetical protein ACYSWZ_07005 [Planctomycetota bacterium]|jgi:hypothetical protein
MNPYAFARLENYYMANGCFLKEGQLLKNAHKLTHTPIVMVNGRYDVICPPINAFKLKQKFPMLKWCWPKAQATGWARSRLNENC